MPNANWSNPTLTSTYTNFVSEVKNRDEDLALQFDGTTSTNIPVGAIRWDSSANRWKKWNGSSWVELTSTYALTALTTTGSVGIGTSSPSYILDIAGTNATSSTLRVSTTATSDARVITKTSLGSFLFGTGIGTAAKCWNVYDLEAAATRLLIDSSGRVGIGTSSPDANSMLTVLNASNASYRAQNNVGGAAIFGVTDSTASEGFINASNAWRLRVDGTTRASLTSTGLGIGTTSPGYPLDVVSNTSAWGLNIRGRSADNIGYIRLSPNNGATTYAAIGTPAANTLGFDVNGSERLRIDSSGRLGVGTSSPDEKLDVSSGTSGTAAVVKIQDPGGRVVQIASPSASTNAYIGTTTNHRLDFYTNNEVQATLDPLGRLGVGTSSPTALLHVNGDAQVNSLNGGPLAGNRNRIINGDMRIDQRNAGAPQTFTAAAALAYSVDRFYAYCTGANVTGEQVAGATAGQYRYRFTGAASVTGIGFGQRIEQLNSADLAGATATLSVDLANSVLTTVTWTAFYATTADSFGTRASPTRTQIATGTFTVNSTVTRYSAQIAVPSAATTGIEIVFTVGAQTSGTWTIGDVQLERGSVATPFERRSYGQELALCQRYFETGFGRIGGYGVAGAAMVTSVYWKQSKRAIPTLTYAQINNLNTQSADIRNAQHDSAEWFASLGATTSFLWVGTWSASAEL